MNYFSIPDKYKTVVDHITEVLGNGEITKKSINDYKKRIATLDRRGRLKNVTELNHTSNLLMNYMELYNIDMIEPKIELEF